MRSGEKWVVDAALMQPYWLFPVLAAPFVGSFLGVLIARLPVGGRVVFARSVCQTCDHPLGPADLVPVLSWLASRGRCRHCGAAIGAVTIGVELAALALAVLAAALARYGRPEIFNTDQGSQFTSRDFTGALKDADVAISMDGRGRCMDTLPRTYAMPLA